MIVIAPIANGESGSSVRAKLNTLIGLANVAYSYLYTATSSDQPNSMAYAAAGLFSVGDIVSSDYYDNNLDIGSGRPFKVVAVNGSPYGGTVGTLTNGGSLGLIVEGVNYRFAVVPAAGGVIDVKWVGIRCVEGVTGWHTRFSAACAYAKQQEEQGITLTAWGVLNCTETVFLDRVRFNGENVRFQAGYFAELGMSGATQANPVVITTSTTPFNLANGQTIKITNVVGMTQLNNNTYTVANLNSGAKTFELAGIDGTGFSAYASSGTVVVSGLGSFFTAAQSNHQVTITPGTPISVDWGSAHGFSDNQQIMLGVPVGGLAGSGKIPGNLSVLTAYFVKVVDANHFNLALTSGGAVINNATAGYGNTWAFYNPSGLALPSQSNVTTLDQMLWNGKIIRLGICVRAATNGSNKDYMHQNAVVWGDGNFDGTTQPTCVRVSHENDDSPNGDYEYVGAYGYVGVAIQNSSEKHALSVHSQYDYYQVFVPKGTSADTLRVKTHGNACMCWYYEHPGISTSVAMDFDVESNNDPASQNNQIGGQDIPTAVIQNGKATSIGGEYRANNGFYGIWIGGVINETSASMRYGADTVIFNNLRMVHTKGVALTVTAARYIAGQLHIKDTDNANGVLAANTPLIVLGRVGDASNFFVDGNDIINFEGVNVGGALAGGYAPYGVHLGHYAMSMTTTLTYNPDSNDGTKGTKRTGSTGFPTTSLAAHFVVWDACEIDISGSRGNLTIDSGVTSGEVLVDWMFSAHAATGASAGVPGYTITNNSSAPATITTTI